MSIKIRFLFSHMNRFPENLGCNEWWTMWKISSTHEIDGSQVSRMMGCSHDGWLLLDSEERRNWHSIIQRFKETKVPAMNFCTVEVIPKLYVMFYNNKFNELHYNIFVFYKKRVSSWNISDIMQLHRENLKEISMISNFSKILKLKNVTWHREMDIIMDSVTHNCLKSVEKWDNLKKKNFATECYYCSRKIAKSIANTETSTYSRVAVQNLPPINQFRYDRQVEMHVKFTIPHKREEIYDKLVKLHFNFKNKLSATIQLPGLKATLYESQSSSYENFWLYRKKLQEVYRIGEYEPEVTISRVPPQITEEIAQVTNDSAELIWMNNFKDKYGIQTGRRHVIIKWSTLQHIPRFTKMGSVTLLVWYEGQPPFCEYCRTDGHERGLWRIIKENYGRKNKTDKILKEEIHMLLPSNRQCRTTSSNYARVITTPPGRNLKQGIPAVGISETTR